MSGRFLQNLISQPVTTPQFHVPLTNRPDRKNVTFFRQNEGTIPPVAPRFSAKVAFLTDDHSDPAQEALLLIVEHSKLGDIVGEASLGTAGVVNLITLPGSYMLQFTGMKVLKNDGSRNHGVGVRPTIPVTRTRAGVAAGRDEILESAVVVVSK